MECNIAGLVIGSLFVIEGWFLIEMSLFGAPLLFGIMMLPMGIGGVGIGAVGIYNNLNDDSPFITELSRRDAAVSEGLR